MKIMTLLTRFSFLCVLGDIIFFATRHNLTPMKIASNILLLIGFLSFALVMIMANVNKFNQIYDEKNHWK